MSMGSKPDVSRQLALPFPHAAHYDLDDFCRALSNEAAMTWVERTSQWPDGRLAIWGAEGRGKTHLLHCWTRARGARLLSGPALRGMIAVTANGVAIDDADVGSDEEALVHLLNAAREMGRPVLLAGRTSPARWSVRLPDLASRLRAMAAVEVSRPEDELLRTLFCRLLAARQLVVTEAVQEWLLRRLPRSAAALREAACRLDHVALAAGGRITRTTGAAILSEMREWVGDESLSDDVLMSSHPAMWPATSKVI